MGFDRKRRGKGRDKRDGFGDESFEGYRDTGPAGAGFGAPRFGGGGFDGARPGGAPGGGAPGGGFRRGPGTGGGAGAGGGGMPAQVVGNGSGIVKFFNAQKGFGFIQCDDRPDDVFVHISAVEQAGLAGLAEGQPLSFTLVDRGGKISASDLVIDGEPLPVPEREPRPERPERGGFGGDRGSDRGGFGGDRGGARGSPPQRQLTGEHTAGVVKFFNDIKGFGFIEREDGGADAFVHISAIERSGLGTVQQGDRVEFDIEVDQRGKFAAVNLVRAPA